jgi:hypothetical protein
LVAGAGAQGATRASSALSAGARAPGLGQRGSAEGGAQPAARGGGHGVVRVGGELGEERALSLRVGGEDRRRRRAHRRGTVVR